VDERAGWLVPNLVHRRGFEPAGGGIAPRRPGPESLALACCLSNAT
jgi:hypothetical protein